MFSDSPKTFDTGNFTLQYPHEYQSLGTWKYNNYVSAYQGSIGNGYSSITIQMFPISKSLKDYVKDDLPFNGIDDFNMGGTVNVDNVEGYILKDKDSKWTNVMFEKDGNLYQIVFNGDSQQNMDDVINSFKFK